MSGPRDQPEPHGIDDARGTGAALGVRGALAGEEPSQPFQRELAEPLALTDEPFLERRTPPGRRQD
jgi:hypothetical protein